MLKNHQSDRSAKKEGTFRLGLKIYLGEKCATRRSFRGFLFSPNSLVFGWLVGWLCAAHRR